MTMALPLGNTEKWITTNDKIGREQFQNGQFSKAVETYNRILSTVRQVEGIKNVQFKSSVYGLLDARAAALEKVAQFEKAIRDANEMVRISPRDLRGFLRKARIEIMAKSPLQAQQTYRKALTVCRKDDPKRPTVEQLLHKLETNIKAGKYKERRRDPASLPLEIQHMIFELLPYHQLSSSMRVSKAWRQSILSLKSMRTTIDLSKVSWDKMGMKAWRTILKRLDAYPSKIIVPDLSDTPSALFVALHKLVTACQSLEELRMTTRKILVQEKWHPLATFLKACYFENGQSKWTQNLKILVDVNPNKVGVISEIFRLSPKLEVISLDRVIPCLEFPPPSEWHLYPRPPLRVCRVKFNLTHNRGTITEQNDTMTRFIDYILDRGRETLTELSISGFCYTRDNETIPLDFSCLQNLKHLSLTSPLTMLCPILPSTLERLSLSFCSIMSDGEAPFTDMKFPTLNRLDIVSYDSFEAQRPFVLHLLNSIVSTNPGVLRTLRLGSFHSCSEVREVLDTGICSSLVDFQLRIATEMADDLADDMIRALPKLEVLNVNESSITGYFIRRLVDSIPTLQHIDLTKCVNVSSDTRTWLESKQISYEWDFNRSALSGGSKIRYGT